MTLFEFTFISFFTILNFQRHIVITTASISADDRKPSFESNSAGQDPRRGEFEATRRVQHRNSSPASVQKKEPETNNPVLNRGRPKQIVSDKDTDYMNSLQCTQRSFIITDPSRPENPIILTSPGFLELTQYSLGEVIGRNCRFMQGPGTDPEQLNILRLGIAEGRDTTVTLLNYKKDGTKFWNQVFVAGLKNAMVRLSTTLVYKQR